MIDPGTPADMAFSRAGFSAYFRSVHWRLFKGLFTPGFKRPDYKDAATITGLLGELEKVLSRPAPADTAIPRQIFMLWQQGWDKAPPLVRACAESWRRQNPDWQLHLLDNEGIAEFLPALPNIPERAARTTQSNIVRLALLQRHGGVWADATLFCARPLDDWLPQVAGPNLFLFSYPRPYRLAEIWFMAAAPQNGLLTAWQQMVAAYWRHFSRPHHYYWMEFLLGYLVDTDPEAAAVWQKVVKLGPHASEIVAANRFNQQTQREVFDLIDRNSVPVHKLSHKWRFDGDLSGTPVGKLTGLRRL